MDFEPLPLSFPDWNWPSVLITLFIFFVTLLFYIAEHNEAVANMLKKYYPIIAAFCILGIIFTMTFLIVGAIDTWGSTQPWIMGNPLVKLLFLTVVPVGTAWVLTIIANHIPNIPFDATASEKNTLTKTLKELANANKSVADTNKELYKRLDKLIDTLEKQKR